jgi:hypothetical protein
MCFQFILRKPFLLLVTSSLLCAFTPVAFACSGPTSGEFREQNRLIVNRYGIVAIGVFALIVAVYLIRGRVGLVIVLLAALVGFFHPVFHFGEDGSPDCGQHFAENAPYVTAILGALLVAQVGLWVFRRKPHLIATRT